MFLHYGNCQVTYFKIQESNFNDIERAWYLMLLTLFYILELRMFLSIYVSSHQILICLCISYSGICTDTELVTNKLEIFLVTAVITWPKLRYGKYNNQCKYVNNIIQKIFIRQLQTICQIFQYCQTEDMFQLQISCSC